MDTKFKTNWKITIGWKIFYMWFTFWWKLFQKRIEGSNTCSVMSMLVAFWRIEHSNLLCDSSWLKYLITKTACMLRVACVFGEIGVSKIKCPVKSCARNRRSANLPREYVLHIWSSLQIYYIRSSSLVFSLTINKFCSSELAEYFLSKVVFQKTNLRLFLYTKNIPSYSCISFRVYTFLI